MLCIRLTDRARHQRQQERRTRSRQQLRAIALERDDGRLQAYGWSLPAKFLTSFNSNGCSGSSSASISTHVAVPVPVYCRPVSDFAGVKVRVADWLFYYIQLMYCNCSCLPLGKLWNFSN